MKIRLLFNTAAVVCYLLTFSIKTTAQQSFCAKNYTTDVMAALVQTPDGGYALGGYSPDSAGTYGFHLMKTGAAGNLLWTRTVGGIYEEWGYSLINTWDKGFAMAGLTYSFGQGWHDAYIVKLDSLGYLQWSRVVGGSDFDYLTSIVQTSDSGYVAAGTTRSFGAGSYDVYIIKLDRFGNVQWTRTVGGTGSDGDFLGTSVIQTTDGGYAVTGTTGSSATSIDIYLVKLNPDGTLAWTQTIGGSVVDDPYGIVQTSDGGYAIAGATSSFSNGDYDFYLVKVDAAGNVQWTRTAGGSMHEQCYGFVKTTDNGFALIGRSNSFNTSYFDGYMVKFDANGTFLWSRTIGSSDPQDTEELKDIVQTSDGGFALTGGTRNFSFGVQSTHCYFVKLDANANGCCVKGIDEGQTGTGGANLPTAGVAGSGGISTSGGVVKSYGTLSVTCSGMPTAIGETDFTNKLSLFPNPFASETTLQTEDFLDHATISILSCVGQIIGEMRDVSGYTATISKGNLAAGVYFIHVKQGGKAIAIKKMIVTG